MPEPKMYAFIIDPKKEANLEALVMRILKRKVKGVPNALRQSQLHKMVGCATRAAYLGYMLESMQERKLIMRDGHRLWALWDAPRNVAQREWTEQCEREWKESEIRWANSPAGKAEKARQEARERQAFQERFFQGLYDFLDGDEDELFDLVQRLFIAFSPKHFKHSMVNY